jgi:hypothetical protein
MKRLFPVRSSLLKVPFCLLGAAYLSGCATDAMFPTSEAVVASPQISMPSIQGTNYGGHAPVVGSKVFLLQAGQSGYGSKATSLLTAAAGGTDTTVVGTSGSPAYYTTTDSSGYFNISGEYTCTAGLPVYLYAYSGAPDASPVGPSNLSSASATSGTGNLVVTFVVDNEKFYVGQSVTFAGIPAGNTFAGFNGTTQTVSAVSGTDNQSFSVTLGPSSATIASTPVSGTVTPVGVQNPAIVNVAVLGNCPSGQSAATTIGGIPVGTSSYQLTGISASDIAKLVVGEQILGPGVGPAGNPTTITAINAAAGTITMAALDTGGNGVTAYTYTIYSNNFGSSSSTPINFVYINEVSTAAAMFALAPFAETSTISGGVVTRTGTDAQHIGIPSSDAMALTGIQNAAVNAGQLYDIQGSNTGSGCPNGQCPNGESHIARSVVPNSGTGKGVATVPQSLLDTLGNILAACVDSNNTYGLGATGGTASLACQKLFQTATSNGVPVSSFGATTPTDIATAAINIAHYPAGNGANAGTFVNSLYTIPTGIVPFAPNLSSQPTDFVIGINITVPQGTNPTNYLGSSGTAPAAAKPTAIATDAYGDAYVGTTGCGNGSAESATNGYGCVLQLLPTQLLPGLPTVSGVGFAQGVRSIAMGPSGKVWATGALETGQTVNGYTPPAGAFYIVVTTVSPSAPLVTGASGTTGAFAAYGNTGVNGVPGTYTNFYGNPTAIALNGNATAYIADSTKNYLHLISGVNGTPSYTTINQNADYLIQSSATSTVNCEANVTAVAIGAASSAYGGAYNVWTGSSAGTGSQGMCTIADPNTTSLTASQGNNPTVNTVTPIEQAGPQYTPTSLAVDANDVGWDTNQSPGNTSYQTGEAFPNNGQAAYGTAFGFAQSNTTTPTGIAIDGNNNLWITNMGSNSVSAYTNPGVPATGTQAARISPAGTSAGSNNGGYTAGSTLSGPAAIAIDISGDVWVTNTSSSGVGYSVTELIGVAAPTYSGLSAARAANKLGAKP